MGTRFFLVGALVVGLAGCAATVKPMQTPNGLQGFLVSCDGSADDWTSCYGAATKACGGKYRVLDKTESSTASPYGPIVRRALVIECPSK
jgi:hypothetical protein